MRLANFFSTASPSNATALLRASRRTPAAPRDALATSSNREGWTAGLCSEGTHRTCSVEPENIDKQAISRAVRFMEKFRARPLARDNTTLMLSQSDTMRAPKDVCDLKAWR